MAFNETRQGALKMADLNSEEMQKYKKLAEEHAEFLYRKIFKPAFVMAFIHGAKHMRDDEQIERTDK